MTIWPASYLIPQFCQASQSFAARVFPSSSSPAADVDAWEQAHFAEDEIRNRVKAAKKQYEDALREKFFGF